MLASKEGWSTHLNKCTARRAWSPPRKHVAHKPSGTKGSLSGLKGVQRVGGDEVWPSVCPSVENPDLVYQETGNPQSLTHPRPTECDSRQSIQTRPDHSNRMVPSPRGLPSHILLLASAPSRLVCHQFQQQTAQVCVTGSRPPCMGTQSVLGRSGPICLPTSSHLGQSAGEVAGLPMQQNHTDCTGVTQHSLVLGSSGHVQSDASVPAQSTQSGDSTIEPYSELEPVKPEPTCLAPRATAIKEQGFSEAVATWIEAPQRGSTRSIYEAKWTIFTKWCLSNQVDFRAPPLKAIADFLLYLFQDRRLQPGTIDGYR